MSQTATNPETGERVELVDGQWSPIKTATNPETGEKVEFIGGAWKPVAAEKSKLNDRIAGGLREFADDGNVFPDGLAESAIDMAAKGLAAVVDDPVQAGKTAFNAAIVEPLESIVELPRNVFSGYRSGVLGAVEKIKGNDETASLYAQEALSDVNSAGVGALNALTLGKGGSGVNVASRASRAAPSQTSSLAADFARSNVDPSIAGLTDNGFVQEATQRIGENAFAGGAVRKNTAKQISQTEARQKAIADGLDAGADASGAGEAIIAGVQNHKSLAGRYYDAAFSRIDLAAAAPRANKTLGKIQDELRKFDNQELQEMFEPTALARIRGQLDGGGDISIKDLRQLRTEVRLAKSKPKISMDQNDAALSRLEKSLTDDMYEAIEATSGKPAADALRRADRHYARTLERVNGALKPFAGPNATNESAFAGLRTAMNGQVTSRGRGNVKQISELKKALSPDELRSVQAGIFRGMGKTTDGGNFSPEHFVSQWQKFGSAQKDLIFGKGDVREDMEALIRVMGATSRAPVTNFSQSGVAVQNFASAAGLANLATLPITAFGLTTANVSGRLLTNPKYVGLLRKTAQAEYAVRQAPKSAAAAASLLNAKKEALATMAVITNADATLKDELEPFRQYLLNESQEAAVSGNKLSTAAAQR